MSENWLNLLITAIHRLCSSAALL